MVWNRRIKMTLFSRIGLIRLEGGDEEFVGGGLGLARAEEEGKGEQGGGQAFHGQAQETRTGEDFFPARAGKGDRRGLEGSMTELGFLIAMRGCSSAVWICQRGDLLGLWVLLVRRPSVCPRLEIDINLMVNENLQYDKDANPGP